MSYKPCTKNSYLTGIFESLSEILSLFVLLLGVSVIVGWMFDITFLKSVLPGASAMKVNAALGLILLSASLWMLQSKRAHNPAFRLTARLCSSAAILIGAIALLEYIAGWDAGIDQLFIKENPGAAFTTYPGRLSPLTALNMVLAGLAILTIDARDWRGIQPGHAALFLVGTTSLLTFLGHLYGVPHILYFLPGSSAIAFNAAFGFLVLTVAILFARPARGATAILISDTAGGVLARRMLFPSVIFMIVIDYALNAGEKAGLYDADSETAIHNTLLIAFFAGIIIATAKLLEKSDIHRERAEIERNRFFHLLPDLVCIVGMNGYFKEINQAFMQTLGYGEKELLEKPFLEFLHPDDRAATMAKIVRQLRGITTFNFENRYLCRDGSYKWLSWRAISPDGGIGENLLYAIARDVTEQKRREKNVSFEMRELQEIVESNTDLFYAVNLEGNLIKWNRALEEFTGLSPQELMLKPVVTFFHEGDRPLVSRRIREVFEKGYSDVEARLVRGDGGFVWFLCNGYLLRNMDGTVTGFAGTGRDISERKRMEWTLRQSEERYRELFENASDYVYTSGMDGIFTSANRALCERSGYRAEELIGFPLGKIVPPASIEEARKMTEAKMKEGRTYTRYEIEIIAKNGEIIPIELNTRLIIVEGKPAGVQGIGRDISERKRREKDIFFEMHELREIVESNTDIFYIHNLEGKIIKWNKALEKLTGLSRQELMLKPALEFVCEEDRPLVMQRMREVFEKGFSGVEARFIGADGILIPCLCNGYVLKDVNGNVTGFAGTGRDITGRKEAEEKLKAAKEAAEAAILLKDKFVSLLAHDLRAPLSTITLLQKVTMSAHKDSQCGECKTALGKSVGICETMLQMTDDLLESARLQSGAIRLNRKICRMRDICEMALDDLNYLAVKKEIVLKNEMPSEAKMYVDRVLFQRVVHNLVTNALKFSNKGGVVTVFLPGGNNKQLAVKDTGTGIHESLLPDLFKYEVKTTTVGTSGERGTGFGLPMSMDIMKAHGGTIRATSQIGEGSTFFVEVPEIKPLVLVADDDEILIFTLRACLEKMGAEVLTAQNGAVALEIIQGREPVLIITDLRMPVMDGFNLLQKLKTSAKHSHIPVIIMTGSHTEDIDIRKKAFECKADDFITKPLSEPDFIPRVNRFIAG